MKKWRNAEGTSKVFFAAGVLILGLALYNLKGDSFQRKHSFSSGSIDVIDGDTVQFKSKSFNGTVRLLGIDTPETGSVNSPGEFEGVPENRYGRRCLGKWGGKATKFLKNLSGREFRISTDEKADKRGEYGRLLAYIYLENSTESVNRKLIEKGYARVYDTDFSQVGGFKQAEEEAQEKNLGVWNCRS